LGWAISTGIPSASLIRSPREQREVTSERIRDKIGASKRRGLWVGGMVPLGYVTRDKKLFIEEEEAERVRTIFQRYLDLGSIGLLLADLRDRGIVTQVRHVSDGRTVGGIPRAADDWRSSQGAVRSRAIRACRSGETLQYLVIMMSGVDDLTTA
jgi:hypothetical protein